jgi:hypothetical protein
MSECYVYSIRNLVTGKVYIGRSVNPSFLRQEYESAAQHGTTPLYRAIREYGLDYFEFRLIAREALTPPPL